MDEFGNERQYWLALSICNGIVPSKFQKLLHHFGSAKKAWHSKREEFIAAGIGEKTVAGLISFREEFSLSEYEERMRKVKVSYLTLQDKGYPILLKQIKRSPPVLFQKGTFKFNKNERMVSVVGTRRITEYGRE